MNLQSLKILIHAILLMSLYSCGQGIDIEEMENAKLYSPIFTTPTENYPNCVIDEHLNLWQFSVNGNGEIVGPEKVKLENVHQAGIQAIDRIGYAVTTDGKAWIWSLRDPNWVEELPAEKPVKKIIMQKDFRLFLYADGTINSNGGATKSGFGAPENVNDKIAYEEFKDIVDVVHDGYRLYAIDKSGDLWVASHTDLEVNLKPVKVNGLKNINRFFSYSNYNKVAIDENDQVYWYSVLDEEPSYQPIGLKAHSLTAGKFVTREGELYGIGIQRVGEAPEITGPDADANYPGKGFGFWRVFSLSGTGRKFPLLFLDQEGKLFLYDVSPYSTGAERLSNPRRVGDFKVRMDYFTS